ncbi:pilus assembly protein [Pseudomonas sp. MBLB4136]|uniref:pilus assembly protein n=1 Tax=Pseudomonas sp. MBLB4136 TaxID=3451558 RepID=UPI003F74EB8B
MSLCIALAATPAQAQVSQAPLLLGGGNVPGNLALVPSVEWPTIISMANLGNYSASTTFVGYFDSNKCYDYSDDTANSDKRNSHFYPVSISTSRTCAGKLWSGNYLNWAATQTIDPFRSALTGGYRVRDTATETWLEKARHTGQNSSGRLQISGSTTVSAATAADWSEFNTRLEGYGNRMRFTLNGSWSGTVTPYSSSTTLTGNGGNVYEVVMRVKVCDASVGLETNCTKYAQGYKPEGLIQLYSKDIRYSVFGYLNDSDTLRDGGVLRAQQKYVGQITRSPGTPGELSNPANEWDATTGVFVRNPNPSDASATHSSIADSGVINYLNKFGQMTSLNHKSKDPVSELYYTALRYFKNQGNVPAYSTISSGNTYDLADGFPVITNWQDPIQYACQKNVILGIGDVNTHRDKNLPGNSRTTDEPSMPAQVSSDTSINVVTATQKVAQLEGITINTPFSGRENSAYMVGMAYDANTKDLRSTIAGKQTVSTYWVDVRENQVLRSKDQNQYWLAAKYGGFKVPDDYGDPYARTAALPESWWRTTTDVLSTGDPRPDNFYVASDAANMVQSLKQAFAQIALEAKSTTASLSSNSSRLETDTAVFQSLLDSTRWSGDLLAKQIGSNGVVATTATWSAATALDSLANVSTRKIFTISPLTPDSNNGPRRSTTGRDFTKTGIDSTQLALLVQPGDTGTTEAQLRVDYLRGDRSLEITNDDRTKPFRQRSSRLGDIVNSDPQFIHKQDFGYSRLSWNSGAVGTAYTAFRGSSSYQNRLPMVVVGANDGMLHGFDARLSSNTLTNGGKELFAYVPDGVMGNLAKLTDPAYAHRYYVDATPRVGDAWLGSTTGWKTLVVGATGAGGKSIFALDITDPSNMTSSNVLWEFSHPAMGYTMGQPALVALPNGKFGVIVSSGYHDTAPSTGRVWVLDASDGSVIKDITLPTTGNLGAPLASDTDFDQVADRVYVADTLGNVWRLDLGSNVNQWGIPNGLGANPMFIAKDASGNRQAITAPLSSAFNDDGKHMVFFGTGSFYKVGDNEIPNNPQVDTFYGIIDEGLLTNGRGNLRQQKILKEATLANGTKARAISANILQSGDRGYYLDLAWQTAEGGPGAKGERVVAKATLRSGRVIFTTMTPSADPCASGGTSWIMSIKLSSGGRLENVYFDTSGDGNLDSADTTTLPNENGEIPWSGISDPDHGVSKGVTPLYKWLCFAGSSGATPKCVAVSGSQRFGRNSWRELRTN